ncbi:glycerate kinase [Cellulomonas sp. PhB143]|uniref:glycerate kinase n=1 Tax=Cellulomonas sp. PhB143 TaxID=2485186 RepID=UPI003519FD24
MVVAVDKFKGSASAVEVGAALRRGLTARGDGITVDEVPVADGGEGTCDAALRAGFTSRSVRVAGPTGQPVDAVIAVRGSEAVVEMAAASGLALLPGGVLAPLEATSTGTGELVAAALDAGSEHVVLAVGGSACTDGGAGMLAALGVRFLDDDGAPVGPGGGGLARLARVDVTGLDPRIAGTRITLASDVDHPLLGEHGAAAVFGPQKGATPADVERLDAGLARLVRALGAQDVARAPGAGAAGGVGFAALAVLGADRVSGVDLVRDLTGLADRVAGADLVVTGEGSLDAQSLGGKTPVGVAQVAHAAGVPVVAVCGVSSLDTTALGEAGFDRVHRLSDLEPDPRRSMADAVRLLELVGSAIADELRGTTAPPHERTARAHRTDDRPTDDRTDRHA